MGQDQDNSSISMIQGCFGNDLVIINPHSQHFQTLQEFNPGLDLGNFSPAAQSHKYGICVSFMPSARHPEEGKFLIQHFCPGKKSQSQRFWMSENPLVSKDFDLLWFSFPSGNVPWKSGKCWENAGKIIFFITLSGNFVKNNLWEF